MEWTMPLVDHGNGTLRFETDKIYINLHSKAIKNYRVQFSHWSLFIWIKDARCRFYDTFGDTYEGAIERVNNMIEQMFDALQEIM